MARPPQKTLRSRKPVLSPSFPRSQEQSKPEAETQETERQEQLLLARAMRLNKPLAGAQRQAVIERAAHSYGNQRVQGLLSLQRSRLIQRDPAIAPVQTEPKIKHPEKFPIYEEWLKEFGDFAATHTFTSRDTGSKDLGIKTEHKVIGDPDENKKATAYDDKTATDDTRPAAPVNPVQGDHFIDHPTNKWLQANLPPELIYCAYQLPADCADIAVILRHVWLFYHNRTEKYGGIVVGVGAGKTDKERHKKVHQDITDVFSGNVDTMVNAYSDAGGNPIRSFKALQNRLHPGDILVWEHHSKTKSGFVRCGGHTHTITNIDRDKGNITKISCLQGNQPIGASEAEAIRASYGLPAFKGKGKDPLRTDPGRRIEVGELASGRLHDDTGDGPEPGVWWWGDENDTCGFTNLVVAGPPAAATGVTSKKGQKGTKRILGRPANWLPILNKASRDTLQGAFEAALQAARALVEGGENVPEEEARQVGEAAGARLFKLDGQKPALDKAAHLARIGEIEAVLEALANGTVAPATQGKVKSLFAIIKDGFHKTALRNETRVGNTRRIPLEGLAQGPRPPGQNRAIVIIPPAVKIPSSPKDWNVEVMLHFHGRNAQLDKGNASHDVVADKLEEQLEATKRPMLGILPIGTADAKFGADFESNSYIDQVFSNLTGSGVWPKAPSVKQVVVSAHSGGGLALTQGEKKDKTTPEHGMLGTGRAPSEASGKKLGEVVLFDAINGPGEYKALLAWLDQQLSDDLTKLIAAPDAAKRSAFLQTSLRFKAYHTGDEGAKPSIALNASYASRHQQLRLDLDKWFADHTAQALAGKVDASTFASLKNNYQVIATGKGAHDNMMGRGHVKDALK